MTRALLQMLYGPLIWFSHFSLIYGVAGFGDVFGFSREGIRIFCWSATIVAAIAVLLLLWSEGGGRSSIAAMGRHLRQLSLAGILFQALVLWIVPL